MGTGSGFFVLGVAFVVAENVLRAGRAGRPRAGGRASGPAENT